MCNIRTELELIVQSSQLCSTMYVCMYAAMLQECNNVFNVPYEHTPGQKATASGCRLSSHASEAAAFQSESRKPGELELEMDERKKESSRKRKRK